MRETSQGEARISVVIPVLNEDATLEPLFERIERALVERAEAWEVIFVDDGSTDSSCRTAETLCERHSECRLLRFACNHGKAEALQAGITAASGDIIVTMDADLQDAPEEIPTLVNKLAEGYDLVSGWKQNRQDAWHKTLPSWFFNSVVRRTFRIDLHDFNCGLKAYRADVIRRIHLYGELHRYIPVLAKYQGARIAEVRVRHYPRLHGRSKYGGGRFVKGFLDLVTVMVITKYLKRPLHLFGSFGLLCFAVGSAALGYLGVIWCMGVRPIGNRPLLFYGMLLMILGVQVFSLGVVSELVIHFNRRREAPSVVLRRGFGDDGAAHP